MFKIAIVDSDKSCQTMIEREITTILFNYSFENKIYLFNDPMSFLENTESKNVNLVLMDIKFGEEDGIKYSRLLYDINPIAKVIYITLHTERMPDAFGFNCIGFIDKAKLQTQLHDVINKVIHNFITKNFVQLKTAEGFMIISMEHISCIQIENRKFYLYRDNGTQIQLYYYSINEILEKVKCEYLIQVNRSTLINVINIDSITKKFIKIKGVNQAIPISKVYHLETNKKVSDYINKSNL